MAHSRQNSALHCGDGLGWDGLGHGGDGVWEIDT
jgi:hypothetical protein